MIIYYFYFLVCVFEKSFRQISIDSPLPPVTEASSQETEVEKR